MKVNDKQTKAMAQLNQYSSIKKIFSISILIEEKFMRSKNSVI